MSMYTKRFALYARAHGRRPDQMAAGHMYMLWIQARTRQWKELAGLRPLDLMSEADHAAFDAWLEEWVGGIEQEPETTQAELGL